MGLSGLGIMLPYRRREADMPSQVEIVFRALFEELRFMKRQQWTITNYGVLILAAIYAMREHVTFNHSQKYLAGAAFLVAVAGPWLLFRIQSDMAKARYRLDDVHSEFFTSRELRDIGWTTKEIQRLKRKPWRRKLSYWRQGFCEFTVPLILVLWIGAILVCLAL
jgi:hypothetical protein